MDTPHDFEQAHRAQWQRLRDELTLLQGQRRSAALPDAEQLLVQYRSACEHLALARLRAYPPRMIQDLEDLTERAHALIYRPPVISLHRLARRVAVDLPQRIRALRGPMLIATVAFVAPLLALLIACWLEPSFALTVLSAEDMSRFERMYAEGNERLGRRDAQDDWQMFGFYIMHNIGIAFQCFASGLLAGVGSLFYLVYNGVVAGAVAGFLAERGHGLNFFSFVVTHAAFELTALVMAGGAGLHLGQALLWPGRMRRGAALARSGQEAVWAMGAATGMLVLAAAVEAFWSAAAWIDPSVKFAVGGLCWALVMSYLFGAGRSRSQGSQ